MTEIKEVIKKTQYSFTVKIKPSAKNSVDIEFITYTSNSQEYSAEELWSETKKNVIKINNKYLYCNDITEKVISAIKEIVKDIDTDTKLNIKEIIKIR